MTKTLTALGVLTAIAGMIAAAVGQHADWPTRNITMVIPFAAGGGIDASGRIQAQRMSDLLKRTVVVDNVGGGGGVIGAQRVANAAPDGYTLLMGNSGTHAYTPGLRLKPPYNALTDFAPVGLVTESPRILLVRKDLPVSNLPEFVAYLKKNHATMQFASAGVGSATHLPCELLNMTVGAKVTHIPFRGAGPAMQELISGRVDYFCDTIQTGVGQAKAGTVKAIAVMAPKRVPIIADLATTGEQGLPGVEATVWNAFFFPKGTPEAIIRKMNTVLNAMLEDPATRNTLNELGLEIIPAEQRTPEYLTKYLPQEIHRWKKVIQTAGIEIQ